MEQEKNNKCCQGGDSHGQCCRGGFNLGRLFLGLLLIFTGLAYLAKNLGWLDFNLQLNWQYLWPTLIVFLGLSFISPKSWRGNILGVLLALLILAAIIMIVYGLNITGFSCMR